MLKNERISESELLSGLIDGARQAFDEIFTRYYTSLCAYANLYVRQTEVAENIVQDLMLWLWENRAELQIHGALSHYLFTSVKNRCLTRLSREALYNSRLHTLRADISESFGVPDYYQLEELRENIRRAVEELPELYREAFEMNRFENRTYKEIAEELGISAKTVDYRIQQSLKILRVKLKDYLPLILFLNTAGLLDAGNWLAL